MVRVCHCLAALFLLTAQAWALPLVVSGRHLLEVTDQTQIIVEGETVPLSAVGFTPGMKVEAVVEPQPPRGAGMPVAALIFDFDLRGLVTANNPLQVMGQTVTVTGDTQLLGLTDPDTLLPGDAVVVSGQFDPNGSLNAGFIERLAAAPGTWRLAGYVTATGPGADELTLGNQALQFTGVTPVNCGGGPQVDDYIIVRADTIPGFVPGQVIDTVFDVRCSTPVPPGTPGAAGGLEGIVGPLVMPPQFELGGLLVEYDAATEFLNGSMEDLQPGVLIEIEGTYLTAESVMAQVVEFVHPVVRVEAPVNPADVTPGEGITILGLPFLVTPQLRDEDGVIAGGLTQSTQIEVRGYVNDSGQLYAQRVRERGMPDMNGYRLRGPVESISRPEFGILGRTIDTSGSTFEDEFGNPLTADDFFAVLTTDSIAEISGAQFNQASDTLSGGIVLYIGPVGGRVLGAANDVVFGTVTQGFAAEVIFANGFE